MDLGSVSEADVIHAASIINGQRRRSLNYQSPLPCTLLPPCSDR